MLKIGTMVQNALRKSALFLYRMCAICLLYAVLAGVLGYVGVMGLYALNTSWITPVVLSPSDDKSLGLTEWLLTTQSNIDNLALDVKRQNDTVAEMKSHRATLLSLEPELDAAIGREGKHNTIAGRELARLGEQKRADNLRTEAILNQLAELEASTEKELAAGLITKKDAAAQLAAVNQAQNGYTDNQIGAVLLKDNILQKTTIDTKTLGVLDRRAALKSQIAQLEIAIAAAEQQSQTESAQIERLKNAVVAVTQTPYYIVKSQGKAGTSRSFPTKTKLGWRLETRYTTVISKCLGAGWSGPSNKCSLLKNTRFILYSEPTCAASWSSLIWITRSRPSPRPCLLTASLCCFRRKP